MLQSEQRLETGRLLSAIIRCGLASLALGFVCWLAVAAGASWFQATVFWQKLVALLGVVACAGGVYLLACFFLRVEEVTTFWHLSPESLNVARSSEPVDFSRPVKKSC